MKHRTAYIISGIGAIVLVVAFIRYNSAPVPLCNWVKLSDLLTSVGGLMFIVPFYQLSVRAMTREHAPNPWVWQLLPVVGSVVMMIGLLIREEINGVGAQEVHFPALLPREPYEATHRWEEYGDNIFRLKDRHESESSV